MFLEQWNDTRSWQQGHGEAGLWALCGAGATVWGGYRALSVVKRERFYRGREGVDLAGMKVGGHTLLTGGLRYGKETRA
jgi:hypothetical protein